MSDMDPCSSDSAAGAVAPKSFRTCAMPETNLTSCSFCLKTRWSYR